MQAEINSDREMQQPMPSRLPRPGPSDGRGDATVGQGILELVRLELFGPFLC